MSDYTTDSSPEEVPYGYCHCKCGEKTKIAKQTKNGVGVTKGQPYKFIHGHHGRIPIEKRFWDKVIIKEPTECWDWTGYTDNKGIPRGIRWDGRKSPQIHPSRMAYILIHGPVPDDLEICHTCDRPVCCNPAHLWEGTRKDNMQDMIQKGRSNYLRGQNHGGAKLVEPQVLEIREKCAAKSMLQREIAEEYKISKSLVGAIHTRTAWKHI